jgi:hypothetical protein
MTTPRGSYGGGYGSYSPSTSSFPDTPIYDSLVAERGTPQIAPIRVPSAYTGYDSGMSNGYGGSNLPALPALPALPSGPSSPSYQQPQPAPPAGYQGGGYPQQPAPYIPQQAAAPRGGYAGNGFPGGFQNGGGLAPAGGGFPGGFQNGHPAGVPQGMPQQPAPAGYEAARPVPPRPMPPRQVPGGHPEEPYQRRNLGTGGGGYYQG